MKKSILNSILILVCNIVFAQVVTTQVVLDTNAILIGEQTNLTVSIDYNVAGNAVKITFPNINDTLSSKIEVINKSVLDTLIPDTDEPTIFRQIQKLSITSFDSGYYAIPPFKFIANSDTIYSDPTLLSVYNLPIDTSQAIFDIKGPIDEPFSFIDWVKQNWWWVLLIIIGVAIIIFAIKYFNNKPVAAIIEKPKPIIPAHIIALKKLEEIEAEKLWQNNKSKQHHSNISETLRTYLESRYKINALEQTTREIAHALRLKEIEKQDLANLIEILKLSDLVKFAKEKTIHSEDEASLQNAFNFVNTTKEVIVTEKENV